MEGAGGCTQAKASFKSALEYAREQANFDSSLAVELAKHGQVPGRTKTARPLRLHRQLCHPDRDEP
jgi:hypothetical protein